MHVAVKQRIGQLIDNLFSEDNNSKRIRVDQKRIACCPEDFDSAEGLVERERLDQSKDDCKCIAEGLEVMAHFFN